MPHYCLSISFLRRLRKINAAAARQPASYARTFCRLAMWDDGAVDNVFSEDKDYWLRFQLFLTNNQLSPHTL